MVFRSCVLLSCLLFAGVALGQDCSCAPLAFTYTINLGAGCSDTLGSKSGIDETVCSITTNSTSQVPAGGVSSAVVLALDPDGDVLSSTTFDDLTSPGVTGDPGFEFKINATTERIGSFQLILTATDAAGLEIQQTTIVTFGSDCGIYPLIEVGDQFGWGSFTKVGAPSKDFCPNQFQCSCAPTAFSFEINFAGECNVAISGEDGAEGSICTISASDNITDATPVTVTRINVVETGADGRPIDSQDVSGAPFENGDSFTYTSRSSVSETTFGFQINSFAQNAQGQSFIQIIAVVYSMDCLTFPVIDANDILGWLRVTETEDPRDDSCPISPQAPSSVPSTGGLNPSPAPSALIPTTAPSGDGTTVGRVDGPTSAPVDGPNVTLPDGPTAVPTRPIPTASPTTGPPPTPVTPTSPPVKTTPPAQTDPPMSMSMSMNTRMWTSTTERMLRAMLEHEMRNEVVFGRLPASATQQEQEPELDITTPLLRRLRK